MRVCSGLFLTFLITRVKAITLTLICYHAYHALHRFTLKKRSCGILLLTKRDTQRKCTNLKSALNLRNSLRNKFIDDFMLNRRKTLQ